jgi:hypothetical protein
MSGVAANQRRANDDEVPEDPSDMVQVFDLDSDTGTGAGPDRIDQGQERPRIVIMDRWPWWRRNDPMTRWLTLLGVAGLVIAAVAGYGAMRAHPGTQYFINEKLAPVPAVTVDALGCPRGAVCEQVAAPAALAVSVLHIVPSGRITYARQTVDVASKRVYRREIDLTARQTTMRFVSQCVPGSGFVPEQQMILTVDTGDGPVPKTADDPTFTGRKRLTEVIPGASGCSLLAEGDTTLSNYELDGQSVDELLTLVADEPAMMVSP